MPPQEIPRAGGAGPEVPQSAAEAERLVRARFAVPAAPDGSPGQLRVTEFPLGYVVRTAAPPPERSGSTPRPAEPGGSSFIVARDNGEIVTVPNYPPSQAIEVFRKRFRPTAPPTPDH